MVWLAFLAALGFWWATAFKTNFLWMDGEHFFKDAVLLSLLVVASKYCGCCGMGVTGGNVCSHDQGCKCGDCGMCK
jgi:hypothetical protein